MKKTKNVKRVHRVKFVNVSMSKNTLDVNIIKVYNDNSTKNEVYKLNKSSIMKLKNADSQKQFSSVINDDFLKVAKLDAQAKKLQLVENTYYCASRNYFALALNRLEFAEVAFRNRHESTKAISKLKATKKSKSKSKAKVKAKK